MSYKLTLKHAATLTLCSAFVATASTSIAAQSAGNPSTLVACHELLPEGIQYEFEIDSAIDTREGETGELSVTLTDPLKPGSTDVPAGAEAFLQCVQKVVGIGNDEGWPGT